MDRQIFNQDLTAVSTTAKDTLGAIRNDGSKWYKYVKLKNSATVAGVAGDPVVYCEGVTIKGYENNQVALKIADGDAQATVAGFLQATVAGVTATAYYVWILIKGLVVVPTAVTSGVVGSKCMAGQADKTLVIATGVIGGCGTLLIATATNNKLLADCSF